MDSHYKGQISLEGAANGKLSFDEIISVLIERDEDHRERSKKKK